MASPKPSPARPHAPGDTIASILLLEKVHPVADTVFQEHGIRVVRHDGALAGAELATALEGIDLIGVRSKSRITEDVLAQRDHELLGIGCFCIGTNQVDLTDACRRGIAVFNAPFSNTRSVAEMTIAEIIALHRRMFEKSAMMHDGRWDKSAAHAHEVRGRTLGIVGYGHIGSQVSVLAESMGMQVQFYDIAPKLPLGNATVAPSLGALLETSDVVTVHVPETDLTRDMFGTAEFERMRAGAFFINNARGTVADLDALRASLETAHLGGAALDVYPVEPAQSADTFTCPLAGLPNVILTPHIGGSTEEAQHAIAREVALKLVNFVRSGTTTSAVNVPEVELPLRRENQRRILHFHRNVPGVLRKVNGLLADLEVNINAEYLQSGAEVSYVILDVDAGVEASLGEKLAAIDETIRVRVV